MSFTGFSIFSSGGHFVQQRGTIVAILVEGQWKLSAIDPHDRDTWRSGVRSAMRAASQLPGRGPTVVDMAPIPAR